MHAIVAAALPSGQLTYPSVACGFSLVCSDPECSPTPNVSVTDPDRIGTAPRSIPSSLPFSSDRTDRQTELCYGAVWGSF